MKLLCLAQHMLWPFCLTVLLLLVLDNAPWAENLCADLFVGQTLCFPIKTNFNNFLDGHQACLPEETL